MFIPFFGGFFSTLPCDYIIMFLIIHIPDGKTQCFLRKSEKTERENSPETVGFSWNYDKIS